MREHRRSGASDGSAYERFEELVSHRPTSAVGLGFALGFGLGLALGMALIESPRGRQRQTLERFGRQVLDALAGVLPESLSDRVRS